MKLHTIPIVLIILSLVVMSALTYITEMGENYDKTADFSTLNNSKARLETQRELSKDLKEDIDAIVNIEGTGDVLLIPYNLLKSGWTMAKLMINSWFTTEELISDAAKASEETGIGFLSDEIVGGIIAILWISLAAIIVYAFFKWKFET